MKKRKIRWQYVVILILIIILALIIYLYFNQDNTISNKSKEKSGTSASSTNTSTTTEDVNASVQTITNTLSSSGEITTALSEKLELHATYYFEEIYVQENQYVAAGENILKYSNGTYMTAPYNLVVTSINVPAADGECTNKNYIEVSSTDTLTLSASIKEDDLKSVKVGQEVNVTIPALNNAVYTGNITHVSETGKYTSQGSTFAATITIPNDGKIKIGMSAACEVILEKAENVVTVPVEAVQKSGDTKYVEVVDDSGNTSQVTVTTGISNNAYIEIKSGLNGTEKIQITKTTSNKTSENYMPNSMEQGQMQKDTNGGQQQQQDKPEDAPSK